MTAYHGCPYCGKMYCKPSCPLKDKPCPTHQQGGVTDKFTGECANCNARFVTQWELEAHKKYHERKCVIDEAENLLIGYDEPSCEEGIVGVLYRAIQLLKDKPQPTKGG